MGTGAVPGGQAAVGVPPQGARYDELVLRQPVARIAKASTINKFFIVSILQVGHAGNRKSVRPEDGTRTRISSGRPCLSRMLVPTVTRRATGRFGFLVVSHKGMTIGLLLATQGCGFFAFFPRFPRESPGRSE